MEGSVPNTNRQFKLVIRSGNYLNWYIGLNKTAKMIFDARSDNMLDNAIQHPFTITDVEIHQKEALPVAA